MSNQVKKDGKGKEREEISSPKQNASRFHYMFLACINYYSLWR